MLDELVAAVDALCAAEPAGLADGETIVALHRQLERLGAVVTRDRTCCSEFCDRPAQECQIDHIQPFGQGGLTVEANGRPACAFHNRRRQRAP